MNSDTNKPVEMADVPKKPPSKRRLGEISLALIGAILGAGAAVGADMLMERRQLAMSAPTVSLASVEILSPELTLVVDGRPAPPARITRQIQLLEKKLGLTADSAYITTQEAEGVLEAAAKSTLLEGMDLATGYLDVDVWKKNMMTAAEQIVAIPINVEFLGKVRQIVESTEDEEVVRKHFVEFLDENQRNPGLFSGMVTDYHFKFTLGDAKTKAEFAKQERELLDKPALYDLTEIENDNKISDYVLHVGKRAVILDSDDNLTRDPANWMLGLVVSRFDRNEISRLAVASSQTLSAEHSALQAFVQKSDELLRAKLKARIEVQATAFNPSRSPSTVTPYAALRLTPNDGAPITIGLRLAPADAEDSEEDSAEGPAHYSTIDSGKSENLTLVGELSVDEHHNLLESYSTDPLDCELTIRTAGDLKARSETLPCGKTHDRELEHAKLLANEFIEQ